MEKVMTFTAVIGLVFGVVALLLTLFRFVMWYWYNCTKDGRREQDLDRVIRGGTFKFPMLKSSIVAVVGLGWFFTWWLL